MQKTYNSLNVIFLAFVSSALVYLLLGLFLKKGAYQGAVPAVALPLFLALVMVSLSNLAITRIVKQKSFGENPPRFDGPELLDTYIKSKYIVMFALCEMPAIFGLVYFLLTADLWRMVALVAISVAGFLMIKPSLSELEEFNTKSQSSQSS